MTRAPTIYNYWLEDLSGNVIAKGEVSVTDKALREACGDDIYSHLDSILCSYAQELKETHIRAKWDTGKWAPPKDKKITKAEAEAMDKIAEVKLKKRRKK